MENVIKGKTRCDLCAYSPNDSDCVNANAWVCIVDGWFNEKGEAEYEETV